MHHGCVILPGRIESRGEWCEFSIIVKKLAGWLAACGFRLLKDAMLKEDRYQRSLSLPGLYRSLYIFHHLRRGM